MPEQMKKWMGDAELNIEIFTDWNIGTKIEISGFHHVDFKNYGKVLQFIPFELIEYTHLSSLSNLADIPENYTILKFQLDSSDNNTKLQLTLSNFPTYSIYKHLDFYWNSTLAILKRYLEN